MPVIGITRSVQADVYASVGITRTTTWDVQTAVPYVPVEQRCNPFSRVDVDFLVEGNSRVSWALEPSFSAAEPYSFLLQVGATGSPDVADWVDVTGYVTDAAILLDPVKRAFGNQLTVHYRVKLKDANDNVYTSNPATVLGSLSFRDWTKARTILRKELLRLRANAGARGFLLKRKRSGVRCPVCVNPITRDVNNDSCPVCYGTGFDGGYFLAIPNQYADLKFNPYQEERLAGPDAMTGPTAASGRFLGNPLLSPGDVWVSGGSDQRYFVETVGVEVHVRGLPIVIQSNLWQFNLSNVIYKFPLRGT